MGAIYDEGRDAVSADEKRRAAQWRSDQEAMFQYKKARGIALAGNAAAYNSLMERMRPVTEAGPVAGSFDSFDWLFPVQGN